MSFFLSPIGNAQQFFTDQGLPLSGGLLYTYLAGTTTPAATYTTQAGNVANSNPIVLNAAGRPPQEIWLQGGAQYKFIITTATGVALTPNTYDNISGISDPATPGSSNSGEWQLLPNVVAYLSSTSFTAVGDVTQIMSVGRRVKLLVTAGICYASVTSATYNSGTGLTTVVVSLDGTTNIDGGLISAYYGILGTVNTSFPGILYAPPGSGSAFSIVGALSTTSTLSSSNWGAGNGGDRLINGDFKISRRGTSSLSPNAYTLDRWFVNSTGTAVSVSQTQINAGGSPSALGYLTNALTITGATGNTFCSVQQRLRYLDTQDMAGQQVTVSYWVYQTTGSTVGVTTSLSSALNSDNFSSLGSTQTSTATQVPTATWTKVVSTLTLTNSATTGVQVVLWANGTPIGNGQTLNIAFAKFEIGPTATSFQPRPYATEYNICATYAPIFVLPASNQWIGPANADSTTTAKILIPFNPPARAVPTGLSAQATGFTVQIGSQTAVSTAASLNASTSQYCGVVNVTFGAIGSAGGGLAFSNQAQTIIFTGVEL